jgi:hypothetical protein
MSLVLRTLMAALGVAWFSGAASVAGWGDMKGRFDYDGDPPQAQAIDIAGKDVEAFGELELKDESLLVDKGGGLANVVVYLRTPDVEIHPDLVKSVKAEVALDNKDAAFVPRILPVWWQKQKVVLTNSDPATHNTNIKPLLDNGTNPLLLSGGESEHKFNRDQTVPVPVVCNLHPWMQGYILPRSNPYVAVTAADGTFELTNLPAGTLEFQVWHERAGFVAKKGWTQGRFTATIKAEGATDLGTIKLAPQLFKARGKPDKKDKTE